MLPMPVRPVSTASQRQEGPTTIGDSAAANLRYIRNTIEAANTFSLVPGPGSILMGLIALLAAALEAQAPLAENWLTIWLAAAVLSGSIAVYEMAEKGHRQGISLRGTVAWRFFMTLAPAFSVGGILTAALLDSVGRDVIAAIWLLCYGAGVAACGVFSLPIVLIAGCTFIGLGVVTLTAPPSWATVLLALGFGGIHIVLGMLVVSRNGR
jgi:hypothetical protein